MANRDAVSGFAPVQYLNGAPWNGQANTYFIPQADVNTYAVGDLVRSGGSSNSVGIPSVIPGIAGTAVRGAIVACGFDALNLNATTIPSFKRNDYYVRVADDPKIIFEVQEDGIGAALTAANTGDLGNFGTAANNGYLSGFYLDSDAVGGSANNLRLFHLADRTDNEFGAFAKWWVILANHEFDPSSSSSGGSGLEGFATFSPDNGIVSASASLAVAIATGLPIAVNIQSSGVYLLTSNVVIPADSALWGFGGVLKVAAGVTVTLNCPINCPEGTPLFDLSLGGSLAGLPLCDMFVANWVAGVDKTFVTDSGPALNKVLTLCTGQYKPGIKLLGGRYMINTKLLKPDSFYCPVIQGVAGGTSTQGEGSCILDASTSAFGASDPILRILGGSGHIGNGGLRDINMRGNGTCIGVQISGQTGVINERCTFTNCAIDAHIWNERAAAATEWIVFRDCVFQKNGTGVYCVKFQKSSGLDSFHGCSFYNCWMNLNTPSAGFFIGTNTNWYDGHLDVHVFFDFATAVPQYLFVFEGGTGTRPVTLSGGAIKTEGGFGFGRLAKMNHVTNNVVYYSGSVISANGIMYGDLYLVDQVSRFGSEAGLANGKTMARRRRMNAFNQNLTTGTNTLAINPGTAQIWDIIIESNRVGSLYYYRYTGVTVWPDNSSGTTGLWLEFQRPPLYATVTGLDPGLIAAGGEQIVTVSVPGCGSSINRYVDANFGPASPLGAAQLGIILVPWIDSADTVKVRFYNSTAGGVDLGSGTLIVRVTTVTNSSWGIIDQGSWGLTTLSVDASNNLLITNANFPALVSTTISVTEAALQTVISVSTVVGMSVGDKFRVLLDNDEEFISQITAVGATTVTIADPLYFQASAGAQVYTYAVMYRYNVQQFAEGKIEWSEFGYQRGQEA